MSVRVLIVDDETPARDRLRTWLEREEDLSVVGEAANGEEALRLIRELRPDLLLLDIQMPRLNGLGVMQRLDPAERPLTIFVTAYDQHAVAAFEVQAIDYLLKPAGRARLATALNRARTRLATDALGDFQTRLERMLALFRPDAGSETLSRFLVRDRGRERVLPVGEVDWIEAASNYVVLHRRGERHVLRETMQWLERSLPMRQFLRISRGAIINLDCLVELQHLGRSEVVAVLRGGERLPMTRGDRECRERLRFL